MGWISKIKRRGGRSERPIGIFIGEDQKSFARVKISGPGESPHDKPPLPIIKSEVRLGWVGFQKSEVEVGGVKDPLESSLGKGRRHLPG